MEKLILYLGITLLVIAGCEEDQKNDQYPPVLHVQYSEPEADEPFNGERVFYYDSGELKQKVTYTDGYPEVVEYFRRSGEKRTKLVVADGGKGDVKTQIEWFKSGQKKFESAGNLIREWHSNGQLKTKAHYAGGTLHGTTKIWYEDGTLKGKETYDQGKLDGERIKWDENGEEISSETYQHGELISQTMSHE